MAVKKVPMYIKNVAKSIKYSGQDFISKQMPSTMDFFETNADVLSSVTTDLRNYKNTYKQAKKWWNASSVMSNIKEAKDNALNDLKTGNFYNKARADKEAFSASGWEDVLGGFEEEMNSALNDSGDKSIKIQEATHKSINSNTEATVGVVSAVGKTVTNMMTESANYIVENQNSIASQNMVNDYKMFNVVSNILTEMSNNVRGIYEYTGQMSKYFNDRVTKSSDLENKIDQLIALTKETTEMQRNKYYEYTKSQDTKYYRSDDEEFLGSSFNIKNYFQTVKKRINRELQNSGLAGMNGMMGDGANPLKMLASNPLSFISNAAFNKIVSKEVRGSMQNLDKTISGFFKSSMLKMSSNLRQKGQDNQAFDIINRILGINTSNPGNMKTNLYVKGPVPWNGIAERSLTEVIPTYLRKMLSVMTGQEEMVYDYNNGKFNKITDTKKNLDKDIDSTYNDVYEMKDQVSKLINNYAFSNSMQKIMDSNIDKLFKSIVDKGIFYNPNKMTNDKLKDNGIYLEGDNSSFDIINAAIKSLGKDRWNSFNGDVISAINTRHNRMADLNKNGNKAGYTALYNGFENQYNKETGLPKNISGILMKDKWGKNVNEYLRDIREILLDGIRVFSIDYDPNNINMNMSPDDRSKKYRETMTNILSKSTIEYNKSQEDLEKEAKNKNGKIIDSIDDINLSSKGHEEFFKRMLSNKNDDENDDENNVITKVKDKANGTLDKIFDAGKEIASVPGKVIKGILDSVNDNLLYFLYGSEDSDGKSLLTKIIDRFTLFGSKIVDIFDTKIIKPMNTFLYDENNGIVTKINSRLKSVTDKISKSLFDKNNGVITKIRNGFNEIIYGTDKKPGLKEQFKNGIHDISNGFMNVLMGKEYISKLSGEKVGARKETMFSLMRNAFTSISDFSKDSFDKYFKGKTIKESISNAINKHTATASRVLFGSSDYSMSPKEFFTKNISPRMPKSMLGALGGLGLAVISPLGLIGGTLMGGSLGFLSTSNKFKDTLFGKIGNSARDKFDNAVESINKALPRMGVGALTGSALSLMTPFGLLGGTLLGGSMGYLSTSEKFKTWLFGNGKDKQGIIKKEYYDKFKSYLPSGATGAGMGALGSFFLPGGPVGGALMGLTLGIASQSNTIKTYLFGEEDPETNKRSGGLFGKFNLFMKAEVMMPLKTFAKDLSSKGLYFIRKELLNPILDAMSPITKEVSLIKDRIVKHLKDMKNAIVDRFTDLIIKPFGSTMNKYVLDPMKKTFKNLFGGMFNAIKNIVTAPSKIINKIGMDLMKKHVANGDADYLDKWKEKKSKRDKETEEKFRTSQVKIKGEKTKNDLISKLLRKGGYDSNDPATKKAMAWMNIGVSDNVSNIKTSMDKNTSLLDRISNLFSDFKKSWENRNGIKNNSKKPNKDNIINSNVDNHDIQTDNIKSNAKDSNVTKKNKSNILDFNKYKNNKKPNKDNIDNNNHDQQPDKNIINNKKPNKNTKIPYTDPDFHSGDFNNTNNKTHIPSLSKTVFNIDKNIKNILDSMNPNNNSKNSHDYDDDTNDKIPKSTKTNISIIKDSVDGQLNGLGYNVELISNILIDQFGMPSILPTGIRSFSHKIKSIFTKPKQWLTGIFDKITNPVKKIFDSISNIPKAIASAGKKAVGIATSMISGVGKLALETLKTVSSAIPGILDIISTSVKAAADITVSMFKAIPSVISTFGTVIKETTKVVGSLALDLTKSFGTAIKSTVESLGHLTVGMAKLAKEAIPALFKGIMVGVGLAGTAIKSTFGAVTSKMDNLLGRKKKNDSKTIMHVIENVKNIEVIETVKNIEKISDARIYEHMTNITTAIHSLRTGTDDIPLAVNATKSGIEHGKDKVGNSIKNNVIDITDKLKRANDKKKKTDEKNNKIINNVPDVPDKNNIINNAINTGNKQVDLFKNKEKLENVSKKALIKEKLENGANLATVKTGKIISKIFKKGGTLATIGELLLLGLPIMFNFFKNIKNKAMRFAEDLLGKLLKKFPFPNTPGATSNLFRPSATNIMPSPGNVGGRLAKEGIEAGSEKLAKEGLQLGARQLGKDGMEYGAKKILGNGLKHTAGTAAASAGVHMLGLGASNVAKNTATGAMGGFVNNVSYNVANDSGDIIGKSGIKEKVGRGINKAVGTVKEAGSGIISKILESGPVKKLADKIGTSGTAQALSKLGKWLTGKLAKQGSGFFAKLAAKWAAVLGLGAATAGVVPMIWYGGSIINGVSATNRMFSMAPNYTPSGPMRAIAGFSAFLSEAVTFGIISPDLIAQFLGNMLLSDKDIQKVSDGKQVLEQDYQNYLSSSGEDISFDDYNAKKANASLMTKAWEGTKSGLGKVWDGTKSVVGGAVDSISEGWNKFKKFQSEDNLFSAFNDDLIRDTLGLDPNTPITAQDRLSMGSASVISTMTFGLLKKENVAKTINGGIELAKKGWNWFKDGVVNIAKNHTMFSSFNDDLIRQTLNIPADAPITAQDRLSMGTGSMISTLSFGLLKKENIANIIHSGIDKVKEGWEWFKGGVSDIASNHTLFSAFNDDLIKETMGLGPDDTITVSDRIAMGTGSMISTLSFGLLKKNDIANSINNSLSYVKDLWNSIGDRFNEMKKSAVEGATKLDKKLGSLFGLKDENGNALGLTEWGRDKLSDASNFFTSVSDEQVNKRNAAVRQSGSGGVVEKNAGGASGGSTQNNAVYFSQNEEPWASMDYGYGKNISQAGCGPTSAAMMLSSVTGQLITPEQTSQYALSTGHRVAGNGTDWGFFKDIGSKYGVGINQTSSFENVQNALAQGYPAVLSGRGPKPFTKGGHYVMAVGQTSDGKIIVNDPVSRDRSVAYDPGTIQSATAQAWISDKKLTGGAVSSDAGNVSGSGKSSEDSGTGNPFMDAMSKLGKITASYVGTVIGGKTWDESMLETNKAPVNSSSSSDSTSYSGGTVSMGRASTAETINSKLRGVLSGKGDTFISLGKKYGIDPALIAAITMNETGGNSSALVKHNNPAGIMDWNNNWQTLKHFGSLEEGLDFSAKNLRQTYIDKGLTTIESIGAKYAPIGAANDPNGNNKEWVPTVSTFYRQMTNEGGGSGDENVRASNISSIKNTLFGNSNLPEFGGNGETLEIKDPVVNPSEFIYKNYKNVNDSINNTLTAQKLIREDGLDGTKINKIIELLSNISDNTEDLVDETKRNGNKLDEIKEIKSSTDSSIKQVNNVNNVDNSKKVSSDPFARLGSSKSSNKMSKAYEAAKQIAKGRKN